MRHLARYAALGTIGLVVLLAVVILLAPRPPQESAVQPTATPSATGTPIVAATATSAATPPAGPASSDATAMLRAHNELRSAIGAPLVRSDDRVAAAAQRHAEYLVRNSAGGHEETPGQPGFTGASVRDRLVAQGYDARTSSEVATSVGPGTDGVRSLWVLPYHRLGLMHPHSVVAGWGYFESADRRATVGVMVYDFGAPAPDLLRSPAEGQRVEGTWDGQEFPDVLPAGAARPVGHPVMLMADRARTVELRAARITGPAGEMPHHVVPQLYERDYVAIVP